MKSKPFIQYEAVSMGYRRNSPVLTHVSFSLAKGDFVGLIGPNGSGKTTLLKTLLGLLPPLSGGVRIDPQVRFGYVNQSQLADDLFPFSVGETVLMGRYGMIGAFRRPQKEDQQQVRQALTKLGILNLIDQPYRDLSGGQKQRTLIARALVSEPTVLVLDEPTNDLDIAGEHQVMELLKKINEQEKMTVIVVSHLLNVVLGYARKVGLTGLKSFIFEPMEKIATRERLSQLYAHPLDVRDVNGRKVILPCD